MRIGVGPPADLHAVDQCDSEAADAGVWVGGWGVPAHGLRSGYLTEAANRGIRSGRRWSNRVTDPSSKHKVIITVLNGEAGERPDYCRTGSHCQNCHGEINSSPVVSKTLRFRVANRPPLIRAIAAIMPSGADIPLPCRDASPMICPYAKAASSVRANIFSENRRLQLAKPSSKRSAR
ncbi:hypothetical protein DSM25559_4559 [Agrobacterium rosae]|uniref:Uncharacterized protein n=1 Tax=Agrobacterium rosae TaxID=1972867 RepID=A0A1R3U8I2_9HYPH|nr:hypothetical protein DSM25559_4559 [Agrobacterium rosae]